MKDSTTVYQILTKTISLLYVILFVYAATSKLIDFNHFTTQLTRSPYISNYAHWISWGTPTIEYILAGLLAFKIYTLKAFYASFSLMVLFTIYIVFVLNFSDSIPCSCGGVLSSLGWKDHVIFNMVFIVLALIGIIATHKQQHIQIQK
ncbi:MauE/DoxX family redox-associated membrane protein [Yeosuana marina]|uniref:MauE/DoxX family redox-associated membrane protein n=1 Tax=Yeosuana marina TaxID=1565536 RepID=UPI00141EEDB6|nr:MauE/DoxX family redox-associated membrane protein [Yeosuana marina]